jgi:hypothetical protein
MKKLSSTQIRTIEILNKGGKIFCFDDGDIGMDDCDGNTLNFRGSTFDVLFRYKLIDIVEKPALGVEIYGLSELGKKAAELINPSLT